MDSTGSAWWAEPCNSALRSAESQSEPLPLLEPPSATFSFAALERAVLCLHMNRPWAGAGHRPEVELGPVSLPESWGILYLPPPNTAGG